MKTFTKNILLYLVLAALIYMPIFGYLDALPIRVWDESRLAINAYEMHENGDYLVTHYYGKPDMWNTKPPMLIWIQVLFMKLIGVSELAVRLPSAIAAFCTCIALLVFSHRYFRNPWFGLIAVFVLITSYGYIHPHSTRTGDYDALLTLFTTLSGLFFFSYCEKKDYKYLYLFFLFTAFAVLTKSVVGLLFLPAIFLYSLIQKEFIPLLKNKHFYLGLLSFIVLVSSYYLAREAKNPGYLKAVQTNELGGRYLATIENKPSDFWFYYSNMMDFQLSYWFLFIPCGIITGFAVKNKKVNRLTLFSCLMILVFFMVISTSGTKLEWYNVPLYPFLAILIAIFIYFFFALLKNAQSINQAFTVNVIPIIFLFLIGITPYQKIIYKTYKPEEHSWDIESYEICYYLKDAIIGKYNLHNNYVIYEGYNAHNLFYLKILNDKGVQIAYKDKENLNPSDLIIAHQNSVKKYIEDHYIMEIIRKVGNVVTYKIDGKKDQ